ncbi:hypothetical protein D3C72_1772220 [compost metagenome]
MLGLYYRIWVDLIKRAKSRPENRDSWALPSFAFMSTAMTSNFLLIMTVIQKHIVGYYFYDIKFNFIPEYIANILTFVVSYALPCVLLNYFLIFYNYRYKELLKRYPSKEGKLFLTYFLISMLLPLVLLIGGIILNRLGLIS